MTKENKTEIVFVVDRSGSMSSIAADMRGGFDTFIGDQRKQPGECLVTLTQFDDHYDVVYQGKPIAEVPALELTPRGSTALLDAIGRTIDATGARLAALPEGERPSKVLFVIITDGHENASREYAKARVFEMIKAQSEKYSWNFVFLGANQDAIAAAEGLGIRGANAMKYQASAQGAGAMYGALSNQVSSFRSARNKAAEGSALGGLQAVYDAQMNQDPKTPDPASKP